MPGHCERLEVMYMKARVQKMYPNISIKVTPGKARIELPVDDRYFHAGNAVHGSVYFRLMDDAAYFAVNSIVTDVFMLTTSFQIDLLRPVTGGILIAEGNLLHQSNKIFVAEATLKNEKNKLIALGKGTFMKSNTPLNQIADYEKIN